QLAVFAIQRRQRFRGFDAGVCIGRRPAGRGDRQLCAKIWRQRRRRDGGKRQSSRRLRWRGRVVTLLGQRRQRRCVRDLRERRGVLSVLHVQRLERHPPQEIVRQDDDAVVPFQTSGQGLDEVGERKRSLSPLGPGPQRLAI